VTLLQDSKRAGPLSDAPRLSPHRATIGQVLHSLQVGGAEMLAAHLARRFRDSYRFVFICLDSLGRLGEQLREEGFPVHVVGRRPGLDWRCPLRLRSLLQQERVDLIHAHQYTPFLYSLLSRLHSRRPPVLFLEHGRHYPDTRRLKRVIANRLLLRRGDRVVAVGQSVRQALIDNEGIPPHRVDVIYNGINLSAFDPAQYDRCAVRNELGIAPGEFFIMQVARLDYLKDHATAVRTMKRVTERRPEARLLLIGEGPLRGTIEELVAQLNLGQAVRLLGLRCDVRRLLPAADLFLLTSISEGIPLTVIEAMAAGLPVVSTRVGGVPEVVDDERTGLLAPAGADDALAEKVCQLLDNAPERQRMSQRGRLRGAAHFSDQSMDSRYRELYNEMLGPAVTC
jgi:glycosyltransferase involved in cell wall biosynthesis